jgi:type I restriction enzyme S subunit
MSNRWPETKLGRFSTFRNGLNFTQQDSGHTAKVVGVSDFWKCNILTDFSTISSVSLSTAPSKDDLLMDGDLLFVRSNGNKALVGRCMLVFPGTDNVSFSGFSIRGRLNQKELDPYFVGYIFQSELFRQHLMKEGAGTNISNLNQDMLSRFIIPKPTLDEQRRIARILRTWDKAAERVERLIAAKERQLSWFRSELLSGKRRLPGYKTDWGTPRLGEILIEHGLKSTGTEDVFSVSVHKGVINQIEHLGRSFAAKETGHYNLVKPGDIVYTKSPTGDFPLGIIKRSAIGTNVIVSPLYGVFTPVDADMGIILDALFESPVNTKNYLAPLVQKGAKNTIAITNKRFLEGRIHVPTDAAEQTALADLVITAKVEIAILRKWADMIKHQKRGLMQRLLTGEWRVPLRQGDVKAVAVLSSEEAIQ